LETTDSIVKAANKFNHLPLPSVGYSSPKGTPFPEGIPMEGAFQVPKGSLRVRRILCY